MIRHGQSIWNRDNLFSGWMDVDLSEQGIREAREGGHVLKEHGFEFDLAYTSVLKRAINTLLIVLAELDQSWIPVRKSWRLNERHYGGLTGLNKAETREKFGDEQFQKWRRGYATPPPEMNDELFGKISDDRRYRDLEADQIPRTESLKTTLERVMPYWEGEISKEIASGKCILISAHGNSLRAIIKHLDGISDEDIEHLDIPTGNPLVYELDDDLRPIRRYYLKEE